MKQRLVSAYGTSRSIWKKPEEESRVHAVARLFVFTTDYPTKA